LLSVIPKESDNLDLQIGNKDALVLGAGGSLGSAIARTLAREGARTVGCRPRRRRNAVVKSLPTGATPYRPLGTSKIFPRSMASFDNDAATEKFIAPEIA
jgi:NAD(P)-dependent dehydrogenase (short-subunit alcohol dehydrogenase family)